MTERVQNKKISKIEDNIRYILHVLATQAAGSSTSSSTDSSSVYVLSDSNGEFTFDGPKMRDINNKNFVNYYSMPAANMTSNMEVMTKAGSMTTATITEVNGVDNVVVAGSTEASYIQFPLIVTLNRVVYRMKIRPTALGATAPIVGFRNIYTGTTYTNANNAQFYGYFNLTTGVATTTSTGTTLTSTYNGFADAVAANSVIEVELQFEYMRPRIFTVTKFNTLTGEKSIINRIKLSTSDGDHALIAHPSIILADGTYQIISYEIFALDDKPKILIHGDSMGTGVRIVHEDSIVGKLSSKIPYRSASIAAGAQKIKGMLAGLWQVERMRPEYMLVMHYLESCQGLANPAHGSYATWSADFTRYISTIKALGIIPIIVYPETWAVVDSTGVNSAYYETYLNTNFASELKIKVPTASSFYDATSFHYNGVTNEYIVDQVISLIGANL